MLDTLPLLDDPSKAEADDEAGFGSLRTTKGSLPLAELAVEARLDGLVSRVEVRQVFVNCHDEHLEATYIFPLPDRSAVTPSATCSSRPCGTCTRTRSPGSTSSGGC